MKFLSNGDAEKELLSDFTLSTFSETLELLIFPVRQFIFLYLVLTVNKQFVTVFF